MYRDILTVRVVSLSLIENDYWQDGITQNKNRRRK